MISDGAFNPLADFRSALQRTAPCKSHAPIGVSASRADARELWELVHACPPDRTRDHLRWLGRHDLYFLLVFLLRRTHLDTDFHFDRCQEVCREPNNHMDLWARESGKSEILTFGQNIRDILNDPDITIGIFSHTRPMSKSFLRLIKKEFEDNTLLQDVYDDILWRDPQRQAPKWSEDDGLVVRRLSNRKESTIEAWGLIDGQPTSKRYKILHYDDVISRKEITPDMIDKATREFENSLALTASDPPLFRYLATYQEIGDTTHHLVQKGFAPVRHYPWMNAERRPVLFSDEKVAFILRTCSPKMIALQYDLDPVKASTDSQIGFDLKWVRYETTPNVSGLHVYIVVDPAGKGPHANSFFALWVVGIDCNKVWHVLDGVLDRLGLAERADAVLSMLEKWDTTKRVGYEAYSMQGDVEYLKERLVVANDARRMKGLPGLLDPSQIIQLGGGRDKDVRIEQLMPVLRDSKLVFPAAGVTYTTVKESKRLDLVGELLQKEYPVWPYGRMKDQLDALSRICDPALGVVVPRAYGSAGHQTRDPWGSASAGASSWMSE
jgi:hypothetical protein